MRIEICNRPQRPVADLSPQLLTEGWGGQFFSETVHLEPGRYGVRVQVVFSDQAAGELMTVTASSLNPGPRWPARS